MLRDDDDSPDPAGLETSVSPQLEALERRALEAWRSHDPATGLDERALEGGIAPGFCDRVMQAERVARGLPRLVTLEEEPLPAPANVAWWRRASGLAWLGAAGAAAGLLTAGALWLPRPEREVGVAAPSVHAEVGYTTPEQLGAPGLSLDGPVGAPLPPDLDERIESYIAGYGSNWGPAFEFHGVVLVARDGEVRYARGFGLADATSGRPNEPTTRFRLGLLTEPFTAMAVLQLRDAGRLELDDPVSKFVPDYPEGHRITIEQLLSHTSGIPNYTDFPYFHAWKSQPHTTEQMLRRFGPEPLEFEPGTDFSPTNSGYYLLGAIIERITGLDYGEYVARHIFDPAGMQTSTFGDAYETGEQARGNVWNDEEILDPPDPIDMSVFGAAGGLVATPLDLVRWDTAVHEGLLLAPSSVEEMLKPRESGYGYGWVVSEAYGQPLASFPGAIDGFNGSLLRFIEDRTLVVVLCNTEIVSGARVANDVARMVYGDDPEPRIEHRAIEIGPGTYPKYLGAYGVTEETVEAYARVVAPESFRQLETVFVRQVGQRLYFDVPGHGMTWMHPMGHNRFFFKDHAGNTVSFELGRDGRAQTMTLHYQDARFELARNDEADDLDTGG
jgi:CubicO group peptidase (beta-lactamase class C family)